MFFTDADIADQAQRLENWIDDCILNEILGRSENPPEMFGLWTIKDVIKKEYGAVIPDEKNLN
jgi:hypothetical protein